MRMDSQSERANLKTVKAMNQNSQKTCKGSTRGKKRSLSNLTQQITPTIIPLFINTFLPC